MSYPDQALKEEVLSEFEHLGLKCCCILPPSHPMLKLDTGPANGYVCVPPSHPDFQKTYQSIEDEIRVHGGLAFSEDSKEGTWFGFDTCHFGDGGISLSYVEAEVRNLAEQFHERT